VLTQASVPYESKKSLALNTKPRTARDVATTTSTTEGPVHVLTDASDLHESKKFLEVNTKPRGAATGLATKWSMASWAAALLGFLALVAASLLCFFQCQSQSPKQPITYRQVKPDLEEAPLLAMGGDDAESRLLTRAPEPPMLEIDIATNFAAIPEIVDRVVEVPEVVEKVVEVPEVVERVVELPQVRTVEKQVEVPEIRYVDKVVEVRRPCCGPICGRGSKVEAPKRF